MIWSAILTGKCPRCREGSIFKTRMDVREKCPVCGLALNRETGYFLGAMYIEYGIAGAAMAFLTLLLRVTLRMALLPAIGCAAILFLPFIPSTIRLSRTLWIYWDNLVDPQPGKAHNSRHVL